jgi:hypothetical protein
MPRWGSRTAEVTDACCRDGDAPFVTTVDVFALLT